MVAAAAAAAAAIEAAELAAAALLRKSGSEEPYEEDVNGVEAMGVEGERVGRRGRKRRRRW